MTARQTAAEAGNWRRLVREAMRLAAEDETQVRADTGRPVFNYRWEHVQAVVQLALRLARLTEADLDVVEAAAWLHDVSKGEGAGHPRAGAKYARRFLPHTDFPPDKIDRVAQTIQDHMGLWRDEPLASLESQVLWDADKLAKLGLTAAFHGLGMKLAEGAPVTTVGLIEFGRHADWQSRTVASMHTAPARRAASARLAAYDALWNNLERELVGDDLWSDPAGDGQHPD